VFSGDFKRSSRFGLIGVFVVAALAAVIGLTMGEGESNPKLAMALIFGVIAIFVVVLLLLQRSDLEHVAGGDTAARNRAAAKAVSCSRTRRRQAKQSFGRRWRSRRSTPTRSRPRRRCGTSAVAASGSAR
jgi:predicted metalloprotease